MRVVNLENADYEKYMYTTCYCIPIGKGIPLKRGRKDYIAKFKCPNCGHNIAVRVKARKG